MKYQNFHRNHNKHKKRDPYEKHQGSYTNGRQVSLDHVYDRNNDGKPYVSYARRNYVDYEEKPRVRLKDPYSPDYDSRNHVYTENKPNSSNGCYRHDCNESNAIYPNNSAPVGYQHRYRELPYKRNESNRNYSHPYNVKLTKPQETRQQNWSGKQQPKPKQIQSIRQNNVNVNRTVQVEPKNQHTKVTDNQKNDSQHAVSQNSVSTKVNQTHTDKPKTNMNDSTKDQINQEKNTSIASNTKAGDENKKPIETENKTSKEPKSTGEKNNNNGLTKVKKSGSTTVKLKDENISQKVESKRMSRRINKAVEEEKEEDEAVSKKGQKKKTVAPQRVLRSRKGNDELKGEEDSKGKMNTNEVQELKGRKEGESLKKNSNIVSSRISRSDTSGVNTRRSNTAFESNSGSTSERMEENPRREGQKSNTEEEYITPRSVGFSEKNNEAQESSRNLQSVKKEMTKKTLKKTSKIADIINLNRKITRNTQSFYESQLKMAIELSMKECDGKKKESSSGNKENTEQGYKKKGYNGCGNRGDEVISPKKESGIPEEEIEDDNVDKEKKGRDLELEKENRKKEEDKKNMDRYVEEDDSNVEGREKGSSIKEGLEKEEHESRDRRTNNKNNAYSCEKKQGHAKKEYIDSLTETSDSDSDYDDKPKKKALLSAVNQCRSSKSGIVSDQMLMDMKMKAFEDFLTMSERLYCGRPLVEDHRQYLSNGVLSGMACGMASSMAKSTYSRGPANIALRALNVSGAAQEVQTSKEKESDGSTSLSNSKEELGTTAIKDYAIQVSRDLNLGLSDDFVTGGMREVEVAQKEGALNATREGRSEREEELFRFNCSKLDLMYRVSFNILKSSHRQPEVIDLWGPKELVLFELALFKYGKEFHEIQKDIPTKSVKEIVDMYYLWKKTSRYKLWKANRRPIESLSVKLRM
nr:metastasis-associated protein MTA2 [Theileria orientalis]